MIEDLKIHRRGEMSYRDKLKDAQMILRLELASLKATHRKETPESNQVVDSLREIKQELAMLRALEQNINSI